MCDVENDPDVARRTQGKLMDATTSKQDDIVRSEDDMVVDRAVASYQNEDDRFRIAKRNYDRQYANLYFARLHQLMGPLKDAVRRQWPGLELVKILEVGGREEGRPCCVLGTVYKDQKLKPSILDEYTKDRGLRAALAATSFCSDTDTVALEDEGGRMALGTSSAALPVGQLVTGVVMAVRGENQANGEFVVSEILYPDMAPQVPRPVIQEDKYCALISGLKFSNSQSDMLQRQLALDLLSGELGSSEDQTLASKVVRLVIAGGCLGGLEALANAQPTGFGKQAQLDTQPLRDLDAYVAEVAGALPVDLMPGPEDPANVALPQQPLHRCLLPHSAATGVVTPATNPHAFQLDGVRFLGTSGQPVEDMAKYSVQPDRLSILDLCLRWRHLAPTAPDTLPTYPFHDSDPFTIQDTPHVLFAGNQPEFAARRVTGSQGQDVLTVCVPSFTATGVIVMVNLRTLEAWPVRIRPFSAAPANGTTAGAAEEAA